MDAEGARALARRIAAQEQAAATTAAPAADGQTLQERLASGRESPAGVEERRPQAMFPPRVELRIYACDVEEQVVDGRSTYVDIWWCRVRERGRWQAPYVFREVVRETVLAPEDAPSAPQNLRPDSADGLFRVLWRLVALEPRS